MEDNPFQKAHNKEKRLKLFIWGDSGVGKTTLALHFPKPAVIDLEKGSALYGKDFDFDVIDTSTADEVMNAVDYLRKNKHEYKTLIIDPVTIYWEALQKKWSDILLRRNTKSKGFKHEFYDIQTKDWMTIKAESKELFRKLMAIDMNIIVTAREKTKYKEGGFMVADGETFDGEKTLPYIFDTVIRLYRDGSGKRKGLCLKDRTHHFKEYEQFDPDYKLFDSFFGESLVRDAKIEGKDITEKEETILKITHAINRMADPKNKKKSCCDLLEIYSSYLQNGKPQKGIKSTKQIKNLKHAMFIWEKTERVYKQFISKQGQDDKGFEKHLKERANGRT